MASGHHITHSNNAGKYFTIHQHLNFLHVRRSHKKIANTTAMVSQVYQNLFTYSIGLLLMNNHSFWCLSLDLLQNNATFGAILLNLSDVILRTYGQAIIVYDRDRMHTARPNGRSLLATRNVW